MRHPRAHSNRLNVHKRCPRSARLLLSVIALLAASGTPAYAQFTVPTIDCRTTPAIFNTAYNQGTGGRLTQNVDFDAVWQFGRTRLPMRDSPPSAGAPWDRSLVVNPVAGWAPQFANAGWISGTSGTGQSAGDQDRNSAWRYVFTLAPDVVPSTFSLTMDFFADNALYDVWINGVRQSVLSGGDRLPQYENDPDQPSVPDPYQYTGFSAGSAMVPSNMVTLTFANGWQSGTNEFAVTIISDPPRIGWIGRANTTSLCPTVTPGLALDKSGTGTNPLTQGSTINYSYVVINTGDVTLTNVTVTDPKPGLSAISCPATTLAPDANMTCTATYTVTLADATAGSVQNTATATGQPPMGDPVTAQDTATVPAAPAGPQIDLTKSASAPNPATVGATVNYSFLVRNTGNVALSNISVSDPLSGLSTIACPGTTLAIGAQMTCTATYVVTQANVNAGSVSNTATAIGQAPPGAGGAIVSDMSSATTPLGTPVPTMPYWVAAILTTVLLTSAAIRARSRSKPA